MKLIDLAVPEDTEFQRAPVARLAQERGIPRSKQRLLERYFHLRSAALHPSGHLEMLSQPLQRLLARHPGLSDRNGLLVCARTQTHIASPEDDWLAALCDQAGLSHWDWFALTQPHCAGGLAAIDLMRQGGETRPVILVAGEKAFHPLTANQSGAVLGEMPVAVLLGPVAEPADWWIHHSRLCHMPQFNANPDRMESALRTEWEREFGNYLNDFLAETLDAFDMTSDQVELVMPYNLNLPLLQRVAERHDWGGRMYTDSLGDIGHLFCSDVFFNLSRVLPTTDARNVLCFAAGMGASFAAILLEKVPQHVSGPTKPRSETPAPG